MGIQPSPPGEVTPAVMRPYVSVEFWLRTEQKTWITHVFLGGEWIDDQFKMPQMIGECWWFTSSCPSCCRGETQLFSIHGGFEGQAASRWHLAHLQGWLRGDFRAGVGVPMELSVFGRSFWHLRTHFILQFGESYYSHPIFSRVKGLDHVSRKFKAAGLLSRVEAGISRRCLLVFSLLGQQTNQK